MEPSAAELLHRIEEVREDVRDLKVDMAKRLDAVVIAAVHERDYQFVRAEIASVRAEVDAIKENQRYWRRWLVAVIVAPVVTAIVSSLTVILAVGQ